MSISARTPNLGREDRAARIGIALSLLLLGTFVLFTSRNVTVMAVTFAVTGCYFAITAALSWDPLYSALGLDTRPDRRAGSVGGNDLDVDHADWRAEDWDEVRWDGDEPNAADPAWGSELLESDLNLDLLDLTDAVEGEPSPAKP